MGAERMCMPSPTVDQFVEAVKATVVANKRWVMSIIVYVMFSFCLGCSVVYDV